MNARLKQIFQTLTAKPVRPWAILSVGMVFFGLLLWQAPHVQTHTKLYYHDDAFDIDLRPGVYLTESEPYNGILIHAQRGEGLADFYQRIDYDVTDLRGDAEAVPRVFLQELPRDLAKTETLTRKQLFIKSVLPLILKSNHAILKDRQQLLEINRMVTAGEELTPSQEARLTSLKATYETNDMDELLQRVDVIPVPLALAQAIEESGWGTSRFARQGNALFGQQVFTDSVPSLMPERRPEGRSHRVGAFDNLAHSVRSYMRNLNTHFAYDTFRDVRATMRRQGQALNSQILARHLTSYSERRSAYTKSLISLMWQNRLTDFTKSKLETRPAPQRLAESTSE